MIRSCFIIKYFHILLRKEFFTLEACYDSLWFWKFHEILVRCRSSCYKVFVIDISPSSIWKTAKLTNFFWGTWKICPPGSNPLSGSQTIDPPKIDPGKPWSEISEKCSQNCDKKTYHISRVILLRSEVKISGGQIVRGQYSGNLSSGSIWAQLILTWLARKLISLEKFTPSSKNTAEKNTDWNFK